MLIKQLGTLLLAGAMALSTLSTTQVRADDDFKYFKNPEIDYWATSKTLEKSTITKQQTRVVSQTAKESEERTTGFPWKKYLDPKNDEFFKEGDYTPPAPFMEIARNPTDENIANWYQYLQTKNELAQKLQAKLTEYASLHSQSQGDVAGSEAILAAAKSIPVPTSKLSPDPSRFRLRMYFDSHCPHCEHMMDTLATLSQRGYWIELRQVDHDSLVGRKIPFPVQQATSVELKQYQIQAVPLLLLADLKAQSYFRIEGFQTEPAVLEAMQEQIKKNSINPKNRGPL